MNTTAPRFLAYCAAHGHAGDPDGMIAADRLQYPGGSMAGYMVWISKRWQEFDLYDKPKTQADHDRFDAWLTELVAKSG